MRLTVTIDSATADEARAFVLAFQRTRNNGHDLPRQITTEPTVRVMGPWSWGVTTPALTAEHAHALSIEFNRELLRTEVSGS